MTKTSNNGLFDFFFREWLLFASIGGLAFTSLYLRRLPAIATSELHVLILLWAIFVAVKGLQDSGLIFRFSQSHERGRFVAFRLVAATGILSMIVTNDVALIVIVPLTLSLDIRRMDLVVILEALAANAGSALTPIGNPQNLFIYWFYNVHPLQFILTIAPLTISCLSALVVVSLFIRTTGKAAAAPPRPVALKPAYLYGGFFILIVLSILRILPMATTIPLAAYVLVFDRKALRVDYSLLATLLCFCGLAGNIRLMLGARIEHSGHVFLLSALSSQIISNVPAALLFSRFTTHWKAILWGTNVGGFGSLVASLANLLAYRMFIIHKNGAGARAFTVKFVCLGYVMFIATTGLYLLVKNWL